MSTNRHDHIIEDRREAYHWVCRLPARSGYRGELSPLLHNFAAARGGSGSVRGFLVEALLQRRRHLVVHEWSDDVRQRKSLHNMKSRRNPEKKDGEEPSNTLTLMVVTCSIGPLSQSGAGMFTASDGALTMIWPTRRSTVSLSRPVDREQELDKPGETGTQGIKL